MARARPRMRRGWSRSGRSTRPIPRLVWRLAVEPLLAEHHHLAMIARIQNELFDLGADLATPGEDFAPSEMVLRIVPAQVARLEAEIDRMNEGLGPLTSFILRRAARRPLRRCTSPAQSYGGLSATWSRRGAAWRSTRSRWPMSTDCQITCLPWRGRSMPAPAATSSGDPARRADRTNETIPGLPFLTGG